jgi:hypothetical protein
LQARNRLHCPKQAFIEVLADRREGRIPVVRQSRFEAAFTERRAEIGFCLALGMKNPPTAFT